MAAAAGVRAAMLQLFSWPACAFVQLAKYPIRAQRRRFAVSGVDLMVAQAAGPTATMITSSPSWSAASSDGCRLG